MNTDGMNDVTNVTIFIMIYYGTKWLESSITLYHTKTAPNVVILKGPPHTAITKGS